jgi:uncharacterized protein YjbJ (UPF0337 family)
VQFFIQQELHMSINKDQVAGRAKEVIGATKEVAGKVVGDKTLEIKGSVEKATGLVQATVGDMKKDVADAVKSK